MTGPALQQLVAGARGPAGRPCTVDFGTEDGPLGELALLLARCNGFFACNAGIQVFRAGASGFGPKLEQWNHPLLWKDTYGGLADGLFCFGQDLFGVQFAIRRRSEVVTFDPESGRISILATSLAAWASWLADDLDVHGCRAFATAWQQRFGPLGHGQRLIPWRLFSLGGTHEFGNLTAKDSAQCMRIRGPIAQRIHELPQGAPISLSAG